MNATTRFKAYIDAKGIKNAQAERDCGLSNGLLASALHKNAALGGDKLEQILNAYPDLSAEWLLRGTGEMLVTDRPTKSKSSRRSTCRRTATR